MVVRDCKLNVDAINHGGVIPRNPIVGVELLRWGIARNRIAKPLFDNFQRFLPSLPIVVNGSPNQRGSMVNTVANSVEPKTNEGERHKEKHTGHENGYDLLELGLVADVVLENSVVKAGGAGDGGGEDGMAGAVKYEEGIVVVRAGEICHHEGSRDWGGGEGRLWRVSFFGKMGGGGKERMGE